MLPKTPCELAPNSLISLLPFAAPAILAWSHILQLLALCLALTSCLQTNKQKVIIIILPFSPLA